MRDYADRAYLYARIYALRSRLLSFQQYANLAQPQNEALYQAANTTDPVAAEEIIFRKQIAPIIPLAEVSRTYAPLFLAFFHQFEALNAKLVLAKAFGLQSLEQWYDIGPYAILEKRLLREEISLQNMRPLLEGTYLEDVLENAGYEDMERRVDLCAVKNLCSASDLFTREEKSDFQYLMGGWIAVISTIFSLRLKKTYQLADEKIRICLKEFRSAFGSTLGRQMKGMEEKLELDRHLEQWDKKVLQKPAVIDFEHLLEQSHFNWISSMFHRDFYSICSVVAYLWLLFYQIRNLFRIIEGRRFGFPPERILARIVCKK
jgi:vacuolar-type H+-ATPase subunit C/Vma6